MALKWNCLEPLTAIGIGLGACAMAPIDGGLAAGAVIGGAGLLSRIKENSRKAGLDDEQLIDRMQKALLRKLDHWDSVEERDAATRADAAMKRLLPQVLLTREQLAATVTLSPERDEAYPVMAARLVVDDLARHDAMFAEPAVGAPASHERLFALQAVEAALRAAKNDPAYATLLTLDITIELGRAIAETMASVNELAQKVDAGFAAVQAELARQRESGEGANAELARLSEQALRGAVARFVQFSPQARTSEIVEAVEQFARDFESLRQRVEGLDAHDNRIRGLQQAAQKALEEGDLDRARHYLGEASQLRVDAAGQAVRDAAASLASLAEADLLALQWETAAANWQTAFAMLRPFDAVGAGELIFGAGVKLYEFAWLNGTGAIGCAVAANEAALEVRTQAGMAGEWARTQSCLANALSLAGERNGQAEGLALLARAVVAYEAALEVYTRTDMPTDWAKTQNNLGTALQAQGERSGGAESLALLARAVTAYEAALQVFTRADMPVLWAITKNNLGNARSMMGGHSGGAAGLALLKLAVTAYEEALTVRSFKDRPTEWAMTQSNLGNALKNQGLLSGRVEGLAFLARSVAAYDAALEISTRVDFPVDWAMAQGNMAAAREAMGDLTEGPNRLQYYRAAEAASIAALEVFDPVNMGRYHEQETASLARIQAKIAEHSRSSSPSA